MPESMKYFKNNLGNHWKIYCGGSGWSVGSERWCHSRHLQVFHHTFQCLYMNRFLQANAGLVHRLGGSCRACRQSLQLPAEPAPFYSADC